MIESLLLALLLVTVANGAPVLAQHLRILNKLAYPLDGGLRFVDGHRLLGPSKTWRGLLAAVSATAVAAPLLGFSWLDGMIVGLLAMLGDALSSFIKRRLQIRPSGMALGLDQIPESLLPLLFLRHELALSWPALIIGVPAFVILELVLSRIAYELSIRKRPY